MTEAKHSPSALAIDTSGSIVAVAVSHSGSITTAVSTAEQSQAGTLADQVSQVMSDTHCDFSDLSFVAVSLGPGSFTGLRVGLAYAKALALAREIPLIGVNSFMQEKESAEANPELDIYLIRMKVDHYYVTVRDSLEIQVMTGAELAKLMSSFTGGVTIGCIGFTPDTKLSDLLDQCSATVQTTILSPTIEALLRQAQRRFSAGDIPDWLELEPIYVQASSAELRWKARQ